MAGDDAHSDVLNQDAQGRLRTIVERIERLEQEKAEVMEQIKEVFSEAKGAGFDVKTGPSARRKRPSSTSTSRRSARFEAGARRSA
jgi:uncharacterized protein (UPF0335 family)